MISRVSSIFTSLILFIFLLSPSVFGQGLPTTSPEQVGLSSERLKRMNLVMLDYISNKQIAGAVILIARHGKVGYLESLGMADIEAGKSMNSNTIFRIASMTKPITSTAVMMLYEEGKFLLSDPVSKYIPEFKDSTFSCPPLWEILTRLFLQKAR